MKKTTMLLCLALIGVAATTCACKSTAASKERPVVKVAVSPDSLDARLDALDPIITITRTDGGYHLGFNVGAGGDAGSDGLLTVRSIRSATFEIFSPDGTRLEARGTDQISISGVAGEGGSGGSLIASGGIEWNPGEAIPAGSSLVVTLHTSEGIAARKLEFPAAAGSDSDASPLHMELDIREAGSMNEFVLRVRRLAPGPAGEYLPSGERFRIEIRNDVGETVWSSSRSMGFTQAIGSVEPVQVGQEVEFHATWDGRNDLTHTRLEPGVYRIIATIPAKPKPYIIREELTPGVEDNPIDTQEFDEAIMGRALDMARRGAGHVSPNPMVGAVIVDAGRNIIAEGWHEHYGGAHAEVNVLRQVEGQDLSGATLYVTLEPCNHFGKTPPCTEAVIASGVGRVVVAMRDPNPLVGGRGNKRLREAGLEVVVGVLEQEALRLNESYLHFISTGRPFVTVKMAQTLDGFIALPNGESQWITGELARERVHRLRADSDAVMIGMNTARKDNPSLTVRFDIKGRTPKRIVLDEGLELPADLRLFTDELREMTIVFTSRAQEESRRAAELRDAGVKVFGVPTGTDGFLKVGEIFRILGELNVMSVLVEGGATLAGTVVEQGEAQKVVLFVAPKLFGHGIKAFNGPPVDRVADAHRMDIHGVEMVGEDAMIVAYWHRS